MKVLVTVIFLITVGSIQGLPEGLPRAFESVIKTGLHDVKRRDVSASKYPGFQSVDVLLSHYPIKVHA